MVLWFVLLLAIAEWVVLSGWWCIIARKWNRLLRTASSKEDGDFGLQQGFSTVGAVAAWGFPAAHTIAVLVTRDVDADELTGSCFVGQQSTRSLLVLVLGPQLVYLVLGMTFLLIGMAGLLLRPASPVTPSSNVHSTQHVNPLVRKRDSSKSLADIYKRQKLLLTRVGLFACIYAILMICLTCTILYEWWGRDSWLRAPEPSSGPRAPSRPLLQFFIVRLIISLGGGTVAAAWIWWPNMTDVCKRLILRNQPPHKCHPHAAMSAVHCYNSPGSTSPTSHRRIHHLSHFTQSQQPPLIGSHQSVKNSHVQASSSSSPPPLLLHCTGSTRKKHNRKNRKQYHSGSETQV